MRSYSFSGGTRTWRPVLMAAILLLAFSVCGGCGIYTRYGTYSGAGKYKTGNFEFKASEISDIEINWVSGDVVLKQCERSVLSAKEDARGLKDAQKMHWRMKGDKLIIQYCRSGYNGSIPAGKKKLTVEVPEGADISVNTVSGDIRAEEDQKYGKMEINSVSGDIRVSVAECDKMHIGAVSSDVTFLSLPEQGAAIDYSSISGDLNTDKMYEKSDDRYVFGDGKCRIEVGTVSGDLRIK